MDNIHFNKERGNYSFVSAREPAWHNLGKVVKDAMTSEEAIKLANLDYQVGLAPLYADINPEKGTEIIEKDLKECPSNFGIYNKETNDIYGIVGNRYTPIQNYEAFDFFDNIVKDKLAIFETAGALGNGSKVFITAKLPGFIKVGKDDVTEKYIFLTMSHDGTGSIVAAFTPIRIVCNNTLNAALRNCTNSIRIRHTKSAQDKLQNASTLMGITNTFSDNISDIFNELSKRKASDNDLKNIIGKVFLTIEEIHKLEKAAGNMLATDEKGKKIISTKKVNEIASVYEYAFTGPGQDLETTKGTMFGVYNAITGYYQNIKKYSNSEAMFSSIIDSNGVANKATNKVLNTILNYN